MLVISFIESINNCSFVTEWLFSAWYTLSHWLPSPISSVMLRTSQILQMGMACPGEQTVCRDFQVESPDTHAAYPVTALSTSYSSRLFAFHAHRGPVHPQPTASHCQPLPKDNMALPLRALSAFVFAFAAFI